MAGWLGWFKVKEHLHIAEDVINRDKRFAKQYEDAKNIHKKDRIIAALIAVIIFWLLIQYVI